MSQNLLPREAYDIDETGYWRRAPFFQGITFGFLMWLVFTALGGGLLVVAGRVTFMWRFLLVNTVVWAVAGLFFGLVTPRTSRRIMSKWIDRLLAGDPSIVVLPKDEAGYRFRMPCNLMQAQSFAVGGILLVGEPGLLFVPHKRNMSRHLRSVAIGPRERIKLRLVSRTPNWLARLTMETFPPLIEASAESGSVLLAVPRPEQSLRLIEQSLSASGETAHR